MGKYCPPCCKSCAWSTAPAELPGTPLLVMTSEQYGCVRTDGGDIVEAAGVLGIMRGENFHPLTEAGAAFHKAQQSPLAARC